MPELADHQIRIREEYWEDYLALQGSVKAECKACPQVSAFAEKLVLQVIRKSAKTNFRNTKIKSIDNLERGRLMLESMEQFEQRFEFCPGPSIVDPSEVDSSLLLPVGNLFSEVNVIPGVGEICGLPQTEPQQ